MFHVRPLAKALLIVASALGLCIAQGVSAFPEDTIDPGTPPSESPDHSGELFNFGSTFIFSFSQGVEGFAPSVSIYCVSETCSFPVGPGPHTFLLSGQVLGQIRDNPSSAGVYNMNITITGVRAEASEPVVGDGFSEQTIKYTADLTGDAEGGFNAVVTGDLELNGDASPQPNPPPDGTTITVGAEAGVTPGLVTAGPARTFPPVPSSSPAALGQPVAANVVFQVTEKKRVPTGGGID